jgi:hypothetical protein
MAIRSNEKWSAETAVETLASLTGHVVPTHFNEKFREWLKRKSLGEDDIASFVTSSFDNDIVRQYREALVKPLHSIDYVHMEVAEVISKSFRSRLKSEQTSLGYETIFRAAAAFDISFDGTSFPRGAKATLEAKLSTITGLCAKYWGREVPTISRVELVCARCSRMPFWWTAEVKGENGINSASAVETVTKTVRLQTGQKVHLQFDEICRIAQVWRMPVIVFDLTIKYKWQYKKPVIR